MNKVLLYDLMQKKVSVLSNATWLQCVQFNGLLGRGLVTIAKSGSLKFGFFRLTVAYNGFFCAVFLHWKNSAEGHLIWSQAKTN
ncbi:hypothetical protein D0469_07185 [Peribacillus saganii]|uniref:Uncharacterized protein n=1 Tax=Peribacillus saganii TaxID=2303992 RepID=A0A372LR18_9BACI|nr:hypothetical protein D0469_07185 [Peribacillus saganii]